MSLSTTDRLREQSVPAKWGRTQMGSNGLNQILTALCLFSHVGVHLVFLTTHDLKGAYVLLPRT